MILAVDFGSGGVTAASFDADLRLHSLAEEDWTPAETLSAQAALDALTRALRRAAAPEAPEALALSSMMHTLVVTDTGHTPLTPVLTWMDRRTFSGEDTVREALGADYTARTGCWFHPSFPVYRWSRLRSGGLSGEAGGLRLHSLRSWVQHALTGASSEDVSTASASGLLNLDDGHWDRPTLDAIGIDGESLPDVVACPTIVGQLDEDIARRSDLPSGLPVVAGGGDGFLAALGSGCDGPDRLAISLGTSSAVRRFLDHPEDVTPSGKFCYRYSARRFLIGAASSNGGNVLDWARRNFEGDITPGCEPPLFLPWVHGERAPFWDAALEPRWLEISQDHTPGDLHQSVREAVVFTIAGYCRLADALPRPEMGVVSGNGFRDSALAATLARLVPFPVVMPPEPGLATLRGAARIGFEALGVDTGRAVETVFEYARVIQPSTDDRLEARFERFENAYRSSKRDP